MKEAANALGAKTARACDSCLRRRARWFCGADDAFLCHACDNIVHCANQLASRHERVRLQQQEGWYSGFTRKARTPRGHNNKNKYKEEGEALFMTTSSSTLSVVPEMAAEEETEEELLLCRVPEFDPDELCEIKKDDIDPAAGCGVEDLENFPEFMDLAEFAADVESLLQVGFDCNRDGTMVLMKNEIKDEQVVVEVENNDNNNNNNNNSTGTGEMERTQNPGESSSSASGIIKGKILLRLNYEEVISAWDSQAQGCPWTTGNPPHLNSQLDFLCMVRLYLIYIYIFTNE